MTCFRTNETNTFVWLWGGDFEFQVSKYINTNICISYHTHSLLPIRTKQNATMMFDNMDKIVNYINDKYAAEATIRYATMSEYIQMVNK